MNVLQILPELNVGGVETGTLDLARHLIKNGHRAVVVSNGGGLLNELQEAGVTHYQLPVHRKSLLSMVKQVRPLVEIIQKEKIDIVHARSRVPAWIAYGACRRTKTVFITTCHGYYRKHFFSFVMGWAKRVIVLSNIIARHMIDDFGVPHERIRLVPRSVDLERFKYMSPDKKRGPVFNVGIIGRITPLKGHLDFIKAMAKVIRVVPRIKIWIVGDAPASKSSYKESLQVLVRQLGLWHCTEFLGVQRDVPEILSHLDCVVLATTTHEAFGRVVVEAQAAGVPVVATEVGGVVDIIEQGKNGLLVPPSDPLSMSEAIIRIHKEPELARRLAENAYKKVQEKYNLELMVKNTLEVYNEALNNQKILIIKFSSLGDVILSTAAIKALREKFGNQGAGMHQAISFLVGEESKEVLLRCPYIDELLVANFKGKDKGLLGLLALGKQLRKRNFDKVIDLQNNRASHIASFLTFAYDRYGYDNHKLGFLLNNSIKDSKDPLDPLVHQFKILRMLGIELKSPHLELWPTRDDERFVDTLLDAQWITPHQKIVGINIGASQRWSTKSWPLDHLAKLCEELGKEDIRVVITGTNNDGPQAEEVTKMVKAAKVINVCGKTTVNELACLIRRCAVYVSADSSPLHIAAAVDTPFVALFGPTDPRRHLVAGKNYELIKKDLACSPCYRPRCATKKCMDQVTVEEVREAIHRLMKQAQP